MSDILRQVDEDLRKERLSKLFRKYGVYVFVTIFVSVTVVVGLQLKNNSDRSFNEKLVENYLQTTSNKNLDNIIDELDILISSDNNYLSGIAELKKINLLIEKGDVNGLLHLEELINNKDYDPLIIDLARYFFLMMKIDDADEAAFESYITNDMINKSPFKYLFLEIMAVRKIILGKFVSALEDFEDLNSNVDLPPEIRSRVNKFIELANQNV